MKVGRERWTDSDGTEVAVLRLRENQPVGELIKALTDLPEAMKVSEILSFGYSGRADLILRTPEPSVAITSTVANHGYIPAGLFAAIELLKAGPGIVN